MSYSTALGVVPGRRPIHLAEFGNGHGWSPSIWRRLMAANGIEGDWMFNDAGLDRLWQSIEELPEWQQAPLVLTFDTGVVPFTEYAWAADQLDEFDTRCPAPENHVNHVPAEAELLRSAPETPLFGMWGTSVSTNPFDPWDPVTDEPGSGIPLREMYLLERHRHLLDLIVEDDDGE